jgi:hypothetical protein
MRFLRFTYAVVVFSMMACNPPKPYITNPDRHLAQELSTHRILMLADFAHELPLPYHSMISLLSAWLQLAEEQSFEPRNLVLFLEEDDQVAGLIREYLKTGNLDPFLDFALPSTSLERLEFYANLRRLTLRIDSLNKTLPAGKAITLDIQGPEAMNSFNPTILHSSGGSVDSYFVNRRDSLSAVNAISYLRSHPNQKALFFYGITHLIKNTVAKNVGGHLPEEQSIGNYLAFYLKDEFGENAVMSVNQLPRAHMSKMPAEAPSGSLLVNSEHVPWKPDIFADNVMQPANFDALVLRDEVSCPNHPLGQIFSSRTVDACIRRLGKLGPQHSGALATRFYEQALRSLKLISGNSFTGLEQWKLWRASHTLNPMQELKSEKFRHQLTTYYRENAGQPAKMFYLVSLGFPQSLQNSQTLSQDDWNAMLDKTIPETIFLNCIGIVLIGSPKEREVAKNYLFQFTRVSFQEPDLYLRWWRQKYYNASY